MSASAEALDWTAANQRFLTAELEVVRAALREHTAHALEKPPPPGSDEARIRLMEAKEALPALSALDGITQAFGLSIFERSVLVLCAGVELDSSMAGDIAASQGDPHNLYPTFGLALAALPQPHWSACAPAAPLRRWHLVEVLDGDSLTSSPIRIDERVLHSLTGVSQLDDRLSGLVHPAQPWEHLPPSLLMTAHQLAELLNRKSARIDGTVIQLFGQDRSGVMAVAAHACAELGLTLFVSHASDLPTSASDRETLIRLFEREAVLGRAAFIIDLDDADGTEVTRNGVRLAQAAEVTILIAAREPLRSGTGLIVGLRIEKPSVEEQKELWRAALGATSLTLNGWLDPVVAQFSLGLPAMQAAGARMRTLLQTQEGATPSSTASRFGSVLWEACREQARPRLEDLTQRITSTASWDDIVLAEPQLYTLREIVAHIRHRTRVYETWGFARKSTRGLGISALFAGPSGTGKTMAAEVLAHDLQLDLYRIDLSQVVSKYIGETEKNLRRVFDAAEEGGAVLLFDEAEALFGKRSEVKDSHDRYANIEVSYLLQRMESYRGLAILTTNMKSALDPAFLRRIRFVVQFPFPDADRRAEIWQRVFPSETPTDGLDPARLARLGVAGGNIRNIAMNAAFLAADEDGPVRMSHMVRAARMEYAKTEKPLTEAEIGGWT
jgi:hypothetical protein